MLRMKKILYRYEDWQVSFPETTTDLADIIIGESKLFSNDNGPCRHDFLISFILEITILKDSYLPLDNSISKFKIPILNDNILLRVKKGLTKAQTLVKVHIFQKTMDLAGMIIFSFFKETSVY